jgi:FPC/CPF motif-containing protein YcgG
MLHLLPLQNIPVGLWQQLLHALLPSVLLDVRLQQESFSHATDQPTYPVHVMRFFYLTSCHASHAHVTRCRSMSGMAVVQQLHWVVRNLRSEGARYRRHHEHAREVLQQQRHGGHKSASPHDVGFIIAVPTRNAGT